jgi:hypothetical protein
MIEVIIGEEIIAIPVSSRLVRAEFYAADMVKMSRIHTTQK